MSRIYLLFIFLCLHSHVFAGEFVFSGGSAFSENLYGKTSLPYFLLTGYETAGAGVLLEKRNEKYISSAKYENKSVYLAGGYRYTPFNSFYFLKEPGMYSAFRNPEKGIVPQPVTRSFFGGIFPGKISPGIYLAESINGKKTGYYIDFYHYLTFIWLNHSGEGVILASLDEKKLGPLVATIHSEVIAKKKADAGYFSSELFSPSLQSGVFIYAEGGNKNRLSDATAENNDDRFVFLELNHEEYSRLEVMRQTRNRLNKTVAGARVPFWFLPGGTRGALSAGGRIYTADVTAYGAGIYYEIWLKKYYLTAGVERRKDNLLYELRSGMRPLKGWRAEIGLYALKNDGYAVYYTRDDSSFRKTGIMDKKVLVEAKITGPFIALTLSSGRASGSDTDTLYGSLQFMARF